MATIELHPDFKEFLRSLNSNGVKCLLVGGYAVAHYGYPRATGGIDIWVKRDEVNARRVVRAFLEFGLSEDEISVESFLKPNKIVRLGVPPVRLEVPTDVSGVDFDACFAERETAQVDDIGVSVISISKLKVNKRACGRLKDLENLRHLP